MDLAPDLVRPLPEDADVADDVLSDDEPGGWRCTILGAGLGASPGDVAALAEDGPQPMAAAVGGWEVSAHVRIRQGEGERVEGFRGREANETGEGNGGRERRHTGVCIWCVRRLSRERARAHSITRGAWIPPTR